MKHLNTRALAVAAILTLAFPACTGLARASYAAPDEITRSLDRYVGDAPGIVAIAGVIDHGTEHVYTAGTPPAGAPTLNEDTLFQIGSVTKTFTATLLADLVVRRHVRLDEPIARCLPSIRVPSYRSKAITLLDLAEQNSGLPRLPTNFTVQSASDPYASYTRADLDRFLSTYTLTRAPGSQYEYSNLGVSLLGIALAGCMHTSYPSLLRAEVLAPLHMRDTGFGFASNPRLMPGYTDQLASAPPWTGSFLAPAGGLYSTMRDMLRYLQANLDAPGGALGTALSMAQKPRASIGGPAYVKIGLAWNTNIANGNVWHNGQTGGYHAIMIFNRAQRSGVVLLTNVADMNADNLALHIVAPTLIPAPIFVKTRVSQTQRTPSGHSPYDGIYRLSRTFAITIFGDDNALFAQATGQQQLALTHISGTTYAVQGVDAQITFVRGPNGRITSLVLHQNGMDETGIRQR